MKNEVIGFISTIAVMVIFLSLRHFYKERFKKKLLQGKQRIVGIVIIVISIVIAFMMS